jgi:hypothetical protein
VIVLDEQLKNSGVMEQVAGWYGGRVVNITDLRPGTVIKDEAIPQLLRSVSDPTFITINTTDFWRRIAADRHFCVTCFPLPNHRVEEVPALLRRLFRLEEFKTKRMRAGKVALVSHAQVRYYQVYDSQVYTLTWPAE